MKIGVISDIHGNDIALEATLTEARKLGVSRLLVLGDLVGYYPRIKRTLELLDEWSCDIIEGNHEGMLRELNANPQAGIEIRRKYGSALDQTLAALDKKQLTRLISLPSRLRVEIDGLSFELCHGAPWDRDFYVYPDADPKILRQCALPDTDFVLMGHTHRPFLAHVAETLLCNPGSVGQSRVRGGLANWLMIDTLNGVAVPQSTPYDPTELIEEAKHADPNLPYLQQILRRASS